MLFELIFGCVSEAGVGQMRTELFLIAYRRESVESAPRNEADASTSRAWRSAEPLTFRLTCLLGRLHTVPLDVVAIDRRTWLIAVSPCP